MHETYHNTIFPSIIRQQRTVLCVSIETVMIYIATIELCEINSKGFFKCDVSINTYFTRYLGSFFLQGTFQAHESTLVSGWYKTIPSIKLPQTL